MKFDPPFPHQGEPHAGMSEHNRQIVNLRKRDAAGNREKLLEMAIAERAAGIRMELVNAALEPSGASWTSAQIALIRQLIETDDSEHIYYRAMEYVKQLEGPTRTEGINHLWRIATADPHPYRRLYTIYVFRDYQKIPKISEFIRNRALSDESNYVRQSICHACLNIYDYEHLQPISEFAEQWFAHTGIVDSSHPKLASQKALRQTIIPGYFASERRPLLSQHDPYSQTGSRRA